MRNKKKRRKRRRRRGGGREEEEEEEEEDAEKKEKKRRKRKKPPGRWHTSPHRPAPHRLRSDSPLTPHLLLVGARRLRPTSASTSQALPHLDLYPRRPPLRLPRPQGLRLPAHPLLGPSRRAAIIPLAFWSMLMGTVTLKWSAGNLNRLFDDLVDAPLHDDDLDVLEMEEREKVVKHMWDIYAHRFQTRPPQFWQEAFEVAYEELWPKTKPSALSSIGPSKLQ